MSQLSLSRSPAQRVRKWGHQLIYPHHEEAGEDDCDDDDMLFDLQAAYHRDMAPQHVDAAAGVQVPDAHGVAQRGSDTEDDVESVDEEKNDAEKDDAEDIKTEDTDDEKDEEDDSDDDMEDAAASKDDEEQVIEPPQFRRSSRGKKSTRGTTGFVGQTHL